MSYHRDGGETVWRGDRHRLILARDQRPPMLLQVQQGPTRETPLAAPDGLVLSCRPHGPDCSTRSEVRSRGLGYGFVFHLLPELGTAASRFEFLSPLQDPLLSQIVASLAHEIEGGFADRILVESLGTALCIRIARRFVGRLPLPITHGLSPERLQRVRDYVEAHLDEDLSLTMLADIACLSPYHFSRSFKEAAGVGPQRYVIQRRVERAKRLMRQTHQPLALIALEAGFGDQSHFTIAFRREIGVTPGAFRAALA